MKNAGVPSADTETDLVHQALQGNRHAFCELVQRYRDSVVSMVYRMCSDVHLAEDIAQDTFLRAWQRLATYRPQSSFRNWLYRIAANRLIDILRREKESLDVDSLSLPDPVSSPEAQVIHGEHTRLVQSALLSLPIASRSVLVLREYEGLSYQEIAVTLNIPLGTVMSRLNNARKHLAEKLSESEAI